MSEASRDTARAVKAAKEIFDGRDPASADSSAILVTLEHCIAAVLLAILRDPRKAAAMLNEGVVPGVESRISLYQSKGGLPDER